MLVDTQQDAPNPQVDTIQNAIPSLDAIAQKMAAMRNQSNANNQDAAGSAVAATTEAPVAPEGSESDTSSVEPEVDSANAENSEAVENDAAPQEVSGQDTTSQEIIDFIEFANENPNAKFKFTRNGKEMIIDAKKAAAILGQGGAIHEEARELKVQRAEFDEYLKEKRAQAEGLTLALEFTIRPQLQKAYDEILKTQGYQTTFQQQLAHAQQRGDQAGIARIQAAMQQNERWIQQQASTIQELKPNLDQFYEIRRQQVNEVIESNRKSFTDKELRNNYVFNEIREKVSKDWPAAKNQLVPGVDNIDLISSDEHILSLIRDGLKYRERPKAQSAGSSIAALTSKKSSIGRTQSQQQFEQLQQQAAKGDKKAQDNLLVAKLQALKSQRR